MKIVLMEPLGISKETLDKLSATLTDKGHTFNAYDSVTTDTEEMIKRAEEPDMGLNASVTQIEISRQNRHLKGFIEQLGLSDDYTQYENARNKHKSEEREVQNPGYYF